MDRKDQEGTRNSPKRRETQVTEEIQEEEKPRKVGGVGTREMESEKEVET